MREGRYGKILSAGSRFPYDEPSINFAWGQLNSEMAYVPGGPVNLSNDTITQVTDGFEVDTTQQERVHVSGLYLDRYCITNSDYMRFVESGGYDNPDLWPEHILEQVLHFNDRTEQPGPTTWQNGKPLKEYANHPVTGICWFEANAYATWIGKRLPSSEQWQRAGIWTQTQVNGGEPSYPWGNGFDQSKARLWNHDSLHTADVQQFPEGSTSNGIHQLIGNVWEWVDSQFYPSTQPGITANLHTVHAEIRGGAFDTYFPSQATCQFRTGQPILRRAKNIGFRCCIDAADLIAENDSNESQEEGNLP
ncbi:formylglycine-generating enzyme family protein [bacterium]|nr:formylglycine-generating enzyme family protein [bacterium]MDB4810121.1 formylglycine-generating enzyme family protein [bacterium]MDC0278668.1 formylglycine-generating enzyme family protein [bacterium]